MVVCPTCNRKRPVKAFGWPYRLGNDPVAYLEIGKACEFVANIWYRVLNYATALQISKYDRTVVCFVCKFKWKDDKVRTDDCRTAVQLHNFWVPCLPMFSSTS